MKPELSELALSAIALPPVHLDEERMVSPPDTSRPRSFHSGPPEPPDRRRGHLAPDFIVIGAMKGGTTTLYSYLSQFPEIALPRIKETDYFILERNYGLGEAWYRRQFDLDRALLGEVSPNYSKYDIFPGVPERISRVALGTKLIFIARDPVARFVSHYRHAWSFGRMRVAPADLLRSENGRHMVECSRYAAQIDRFLAHFERHQFLFLDFDDLRETPQRVCDELADFLGLARRAVVAEPPANTTDELARIPGFVKRASRSSLARRFDHLVPRSARLRLRSIVAIGRPEPAPELDAPLLEVVADMVRDDARRFRELSGKEFKRWPI